MLGADETGETDGGKGEGSEKVNGLIQRLHLSAAFDDSPNEDAEHGDLVVEAGEIMGVEVMKVKRRE